MVSIVIGMSGSGKTYRLKEELVHNDYFQKRKRYVIERKDYKEYSGVFHPDYATVMKSDSKMVDTLLNVMNADIIIDCEDYSEDFMEKVLTIVKRSRRNANRITITFLGIYSDIPYQESILQNADKVFIGKCSLEQEERIQNLFNERPEPIQGKYDFHRIK